MDKLIRPALGLLQGIILYGLINHTHLSITQLGFALVFFNLPLLALQLKLPGRNTLLLGLSLVIAMGLVYGYAVYHMLGNIAFGNTVNPVTPTLAIQCLISAFILFVFYCVIMEEKRFAFPYATLFCEAWQVVLKLILGHVLVSLTWGLFWLAGILFELLNIPFVRTFVESKEFVYILPPLFFGIAMTLLHHQEELLIKLRNILLTFSQFLYPIFVIISLSFLIVIPFTNKPFSELWPLTVLLSIINIALFNGVFQSGPEKAPYARWFCMVIYVSFIVTFLYSIYVLQFPWLDMKNMGNHSIEIVWLTSLSILALYSLCYSLAIFFSRKPWLSMVKRSNTILAFVVAVVYLAMALGNWK